MPSLVTRNFRLYNAQQFIEQFSEADPSRLYFFISRPAAWPDDANAPTPTDNVKDVSFVAWDSMLGLKKVTAADVSLAAARVNWTSGTVYAQYRYDAVFNDQNFYVITADYNVYKCLYNNGGATSTVEPTGTLATNIITADGYVWKYLFTVQAADALKFLTVNYMPVKILTSDDGSAQWDVQAAAANGSIHYTHVTAGGSSYLQNTGTAISGNTTGIKLAATANTTSNIYNTSAVYISSGTGSGQLRTIVDYDGSTQFATVSPVFTTAPDNTSVYRVSPRISFTGDGSNASAYSTITGSAVSKITMINAGVNYGYANVAIIANTGTGAVATAQIAPPGGHGNNAIEELYAHNVILNIKLEGNESGKFTVENDFRVMGLVADPIVLGTGLAANSSVYTQTTNLALTSITGTFSKDEIVTGGTSGAKGVVVEFSSPNVKVTSTIGNFSTSETLTGATSAATGTINTITLPELKKYTGTVIYIENRSPIIRASDQTEDVKIVLKF